MNFCEDNEEEIDENGFDSDDGVNDPDFVVPSESDFLLEDCRVAYLVQI